LLAAAFGLAVGCAEDNRLAGDPLLGGPAPAPRVAVPPPTPSAVSGAPLPPQPAANGSASNAALASTAAPPLSADHDLRIADPRRPTDARTWSGQPAGAAPTNQPGAVPTSVAQAGGPVPNFPPTAGMPVGSFEQAQAVLASRGVSWQRLETLGDNSGWKFSCSIPNSQNRFISRTYEAKAPDSLSAIRAVLDQISKDR
jgi:hypothetical protein